MISVVIFLQASQAAMNFNISELVFFATHLRRPQLRTGQDWVWPQVFFNHLCVLTIPIAIAPALKPHGIGLLFRTYKNGNFGAISVTGRSCSGAIPLLKGVTEPIRYVTLHYRKWISTSENRLLLQPRAVETCKLKLFHPYHLSKNEDSRKMNDAPSPPPPLSSFNVVQGKTRESCSQVGF